MTRKPFPRLKGRSIGQVVFGPDGYIIELTIIKKETEMDTKYLTKAKLIAVNNRAKKAGGNHIDPDFVALLPDRFKYLVRLRSQWTIAGSDAG